MKTWLIHHMQALRLVLSRFQKNRLGTLLICLSIGVTLALPSVAYIILDNLNGLVSSVKSESQISVFLTEKHDTALVSGIEKILKQNPAIQNVIFVSKQDALEQLTAIDANKSLLDSLQGNPLPDAFFVEPKMLDATSIESLKNELSKIQGVETVLVDGVWIKRLNSLLFLGKKNLNYFGWTTRLRADCRDWQYHPHAGFNPKRRDRIKPTYRCNQKLYSQAIFVCWWFVWIRWWRISVNDYVGDDTIF